ncbi:hypothetical protein LX36DRAFT_656996 [Colletotrichum falcatum]|nr:hypothetical protein LX36DRAFT_656996 [Colletotrichum falcatum]
MNNTTNSYQQKPDTPGEHAAVTDVPPSSQALAEAAELQVLGRDGKPRPFKSLFGDPNATSRVVVVFIRHFFCGACQAYTHDLSTTFTPEVLSSHKTPTTFVFIGTGDPELIDEYVQLTESRYPIYTDPTGKLFDALGMVRTAAVGNRTAYSPQRWIRHFFKGTFDALVNLPSGKTSKAGDGLRVGGEFVFEEVEGARTVTWCHRMRNHRDHTEIADLCRVLKFNV